MKEIFKEILDGVPNIMKTASVLIFIIAIMFAIYMSFKCNQEDFKSHDLYLDLHDGY